MQVWKTAAVAVVLACLSVVPGASATEDRPGRQVARQLPNGPVLPFRFADPTITRYSGGYIVVGTGNRAPRAHAATIEGPWDVDGAALASVPRWATGPEVWAADIEYVKGRWLLYYSIPVSGIRTGGRCIGVAVAAGPLQPFVPYSSRPLVCSKKANTPRASDRGTSKSVIDPALFVDGKRKYLLYKTDDIPSMIRMVQLRPDGLRKKPRTESRQLVRSGGIIENPLIVRRGSRYTMITSEGPYAMCSYNTTWRRSKKLWSWSKAKRNVLLSSASTGTCGPGGADVVDTPQGSTMVFHGWVCNPEGNVCPDNYNTGLHNTDGQDLRAMYAARIAWTAGGAPVVTSFVNPPPPPPQDPEHPLPPDPTSSP